jgi:hypothetical protein
MEELKNLVMAQEHFSVSVGENFVFEKQACRLTIVNMVDIHSDKNDAYHDTVTVVVKQIFTSLLNQIYNNKVIQN